MSEDHVRELADMVGGKIEEMHKLPDGSGFAVMAMPLPADHWLLKDGTDEPPAPLRIGRGYQRDRLVRQIRSAAQYAIRAATMNGKVNDFDPDAMAQNFVIGVLGYATDDGLLHADEGGACK